MKCECFFAHIYFSNETVSQTTVSTGPMKMFRLEHENYECLSKKHGTFWSHGVQVWKNWQQFFRILEAWCHCNFRKMEVLKANKFGWTYRTETQVTQAIIARSYYFLNLYPNITWHSYHHHLLLHNNWVSLCETWLSVWGCYAWGKMLFSHTAGSHVKLTAATWPLLQIQS